MKLDITKVKIHVFVPEEKISELRDAVCNAGAGVLNNYTYCTSSSKVSGTFKPNDNANPYTGINNTLIFVDEIKLEFLCDINLVKKIVKVIRDIHPYEEPEIDIIPILDESSFS